MEILNDDVVEVVLGTDNTGDGRADTTVEDGLVEAGIVETKPRSLSTMFSAVVLVGLLVGFVALLVVPRLTANEPEASTDATASQPETSQDRELFEPGEIPERREVDVGTPPMELVPLIDGSGAVYPLFPKSTDLSLVIKTEGGLVVLDAADGTRQVLPVDASTFDDFQRNAESSPSVLFGSSLIVHEGARVVGHALNGGAPVDYGEANSFWVANDGDELHLLRGDSNPGDRFEADLEIVRFGLDSKVIGEPVVVPSTGLSFVFPLGEGLFSLWSGGVFRLVGDNFGRITPLSPLGVGVNHLLLQDCDDRLLCEARLFDYRTEEPQGVVDLGGLNIFQLSGTLTISPSGKHASASTLSPNGVETFVIFDNETSESWEVPVVVPNSFETRGGITWTPDGRYLVALSSQRLHVFDVETRTFVGHDIEDLGLTKIRSSADVVVLN